MRSRCPPAVLTLLAVFVAGFALSELVERSAHAQAAPFASTVYVPADGLAFRTFEGRVIARLSYDRRGAVFDLYDQDERPANTLRADAVLAARPSPASALASAPSTTPASPPVRATASAPAPSRKDLDFGF